MSINLTDYQILNFTSNIKLQFTSHYLNLNWLYMKHSLRFEWSIYIEIQCKALPGSEWLIVNQPHLEYLHGLTLNYLYD